MSPQATHRRLGAVLSVDSVDRSCLMKKDGTATLRTGLPETRRFHAGGWQ